MSGKDNTTERASNEALEWCKKNKGWQRLCDIEDSEQYMQTFEDISKKEKEFWEKNHPSDPEGAWQEFDSPKSKIPEKFIGANGKVYSCVIEACCKDRQNIMTVMKTGEQ